MAWELDYNGFGSTSAGAANKWTALNIQTYKSEAVFSADGQIHETTKHEITGTALISRSSAGDLNTGVQTARKKLARQRQEFTLAVTSGTEFYKQASAGPDDHLETPLCEFTITEIDGALSAIVGFKITWHQFETLTGDDDISWDIMSHWWAQQFEIGDDGNTKRTITGNLRVRANAGDPSSGVHLGVNPDRYRYLIFPFMDPGFRQTRALFATDDTGTRLLYTLEFTEYPRKLPGPAKKGRGQFKWMRSLEGGLAFLGVKIFDAELEGDKSATPAALLAALVRVAQNRIIFAGASPDLILSIEVTEDDFFNANKVGLRMVARSVGNAEQPMMLAGPGITLLNDLLEGFDEDEDLYELPNPYGAPLIRSVARALYLPGTLYVAPSDPAGGTDLPIARTETADSTLALHAYKIPNAMFEEQEEDQLGTDGAVTPSEDHKKNPYLSMVVNERLRIIPHVVGLPSQSLAGPTLPYQYRKPEVLLITEYEFERQNAPPNPKFLMEPAGSLLREQSAHVSPGIVDAQGKRTYRGVYTRIEEIVDQQQANFWANDTISLDTPPPLSGGGGDFIIRRFAIPGGLSFPYDPRDANAGSSRFPFGASAGKVATVFPVFSRQYFFAQEAGTPPPAAS